MDEMINEMCLDLIDRVIHFRNAMGYRNFLEAEDHLTNAHNVIFHLTKFFKDRVHESK